MKHIDVRRLPYLLIAAAALGCDEQGSTGPRQATVSVNDDEFVPPSIQPGANGVVTWIWAGTNPHDLIFADGMGGVPDAVSSGVYQRNFTGAAAGEYPYRCTLHAPMTGRVVVP